MPYELLLLLQYRTASGYGYKNTILDLRGKGKEATLACTECKNRNYNMTKDKKAHPDRMETKKYCRFCKTHTLHKETK